MFTKTGTLIMTPEELSALHPNSDPESEYAEGLRALPDAKLIEDHYAAHYSLKILPKASWLSEDSIQAQEWTKVRAPLLEAERRRRNLVLPSWAVVV